ncbi:hypothetical protein PCANC_06465 [Puccinia coronata f. sp. avenae]|uniref:Uncharacterized protein n=1 Tax=Puccinia coronata f. sp. avenae TaxID=200324 RepID=A0A2N5VVZ0_9BASI|nr:hypothetical protein PCANC_06465 [Puccinia coronata f. sp. avenae]
MASFIDPTSSTSTSTSTSTTVPFSSPSTSNSTLSVLNPAKTQYHSSTTSRQTSQATSNCSSFQSQTHSSSSPRDLLALKLSKVKATAALFESRSSSSQQNSPSIEHHYQQQQQQQQQQPSSINHLIISPLDRTNSLDRTRQMNASMLLTTTTPPPSSCTQLSSSSYPSLQLSSGHVKQIKNQFLSHHSLAQLERRHSSDRPSHHQPAKVLQHYHPE